MEQIKKAIRRKINPMRSRLALAILLSIAAVAVFALFRALNSDAVAVGQQGVELPPGTIEGKIPPLRGRILDREGTPLAESVRRFALEWNVPSDRQEALKRFSAFQKEKHLSPQKNREDIVQHAGHTVKLETNLVPPQIKDMYTFIQDRPRLQLTSYFVRKYYPDSQIRDLLGRVDKKNGDIVGVSGLEKRYNTLLQGKAGIYRVKTEEDQRWQPETWEKRNDLQAGYDVYVPLSVEPKPLTPRSDTK